MNAQSVSQSVFRRPPDGILAMLSAASVVARGEGGRRLFYLAQAINDDA